MIASAGKEVTSAPVNQILVIDRIEFILPKDRELLFPAMSAIQKYVAIYGDKMKATIRDPLWRFELQYKLVGDWELFKQLRVELTQDPVIDPLDNLDASFDLRSQRILSFANTGKHACQICGLILGVDTSILPTIRRVKVAKAGWWMLGNPYTGEDLINLKDNECAGVIGEAGWETYLAASYGLPVVELIPSNRHRNWLSKWSNPFYRMVGKDDSDSKQQITNAVRSIEELRLVMKV